MATTNSGDGCGRFALFLAIWCAVFGCRIELQRIARTLERIEKSIERQSLPAEAETPEEASR